MSEASRLRRSSALPWTLDVVLQRLGAALALVGLDDDQRPGGKARPRGCRTRSPRAAPVPIRSESTSSCALGGAPGSAAGRRFHIRRASQGPTAPIRIRLPNVASRMPGMSVDALAHRGEQVQQQAVEQCEHDERGPHPGPAQAPAHPRRPEPLLVVRHRSQGSLEGHARALGHAPRGAPLRGGLRAPAVAPRAPRRRASCPTSLLVLEHPPVYTRGKRTEPADLPMGEDWYREQGIEVEDTDRGGRVTYHGPGQLVGYPIMARRPASRTSSTRWRARWSPALADEGVAAEARDGPSPACGSGDAKIGSIGVHVRDGVTTHGLRGERGQRPAAVRVDRALRHRRRAHDLARARDRPRAGAALLPQAHGLPASPRRSGAASGWCRSTACSRRALASGRSSSVSDPRVT